MSRPDNMKWFVDDSVVDVQCPDCKEISPAESWIDREPYCEDCGEHAGIQCPKCSSIFDHVWDGDKFKKERP